MARESQDREDLLRDATAFLTRVQLRILGRERSMEVFAGIRAQGAASFYFDQDPVFHFNALGQMRRAFVDEALVMAERGQLIVLRPQRTEAAVTMHRHALSADEQREFCETAARQLVELRQSIVHGDYLVAGHVAPAAATREEVVAQFVAALELCGRIEVAASPRVGR